MLLLLLLLLLRRRCRFALHAHAQHQHLAHLPQQPEHEGERLGGHGAVCEFVGQAVRHLPALLLRQHAAVRGGARGRRRRGGGAGGGGAASVVIRDAADFVEEAQPHGRAAPPEGAVAGHGLAERAAEGPQLVAGGGRVGADGEEDAAARARGVGHAEAREGLVVREALADGQVELLQRASPLRRRLLLLRQRCSVRRRRRQGVAEGADEQDVAAVEDGALAAVPPRGDDAGAWGAARAVFLGVEDSEPVGQVLEGLLCVGDGVCVLFALRIDRSSCRPPTPHLGQSIQKLPRGSAAP